MIEYIKAYVMDYYHGQWTDEQFRRLLKKDILVITFITDVDLFVDELNKRHNIRRRVNHMRGVKTS